MTRKEKRAAAAAPSAAGKSAREGGTLRQRSELAARKEATQSNRWEPDAQRVREIESAMEEPDGLAQLSSEEVRWALHELRVHQIELEMQNEDLRRAQVELNATRARYFDLYDLAPVGYCTISESGLILQANLAAAALLGVHRDALVKQPISRFMPKDDADKFHLRRKEGHKTGEAQAWEQAMVKRDGPLLWVHLVATIAQGEDGTPVRRMVLSDVTERKQADAARALLEAQLRESQKMQTIGTLAGGIAHDFNGIITVILGNARLASKDASTQPLLLHSLNEIRKAGVRARDLVQQILSFGRRQPLERKPMALAPVVEEVVRLLRATLPRRVIVEAHCEAGAPVVLADATLIQQALINLATNAMQAMRGRAGRIDIRLNTVMLDAPFADAHPALHALHNKHPGRTVRLAVSDNGPGMEAATLDRIFEPFFTTKPAGEGTGLGLSVVYGIVQGHDGAIVVDTQPGRGSSFTLYLPPTQAQAGAPLPNASTAASTAASAAATAAAPNLHGGEHILYLDDDDSLVELTQRTLERRGYRVSGHMNPHDALAAIRADPASFHLVLTDYSMLGMSGLDVAREVRAIRADLPVAVVSAFIDEYLREQAPAAGVRELILKPNAVDDLCEIIQRLVQSIQQDTTPS